jgi:hypothetical protein
MTNLIITWLDDFNFDGSHKKSEFHPRTARVEHTAEGISFAYGGKIKSAEQAQY